MTRISISLLTVAATVYVGACIALFLSQRSLIYHPQPATNDPATTMRLSVPGAELLITTRAHAGPKALIYFGGNAEDVTASLASFSLAFPDHALYLLHYRGYGGSTGKPSEETIRRDALALFDRVGTDHSEISIIGRSLGSGVAIRLASARPVAHLILVTPYDSIQEIAARQFPYFPVRWLLTDKFESWRYAPTIKVPTLLVTAEHDEVIPQESTQRLLASFSKEIASLIDIAQVGHNTISNSPRYLEILKQAVQ